MKTNYLLPTLVCGFGAAVLTVVPGLKNFGCCLILPAASVLSLYLDQRSSYFRFPITSKRAFLFGLFTGLFAAVFTTALDVLITYITRTNDFITSLPQMEVVMGNFPFQELMKESFKILRSMKDELISKGFSPLYTFFIFFNNMIVDSIFGIAGGFFGMIFLNRLKIT